MNILVIAGYNVLADKIPDHRDYVTVCYLERAIKEGVDLVFTVGGTTNPDYPNLTEAEANRRVIEEIVHSIDDKYVLTRLAHINEISLPVGDTSAETLEVVKKFLAGQEISVEKLVLCAEQSRLAGFLLDALYVGLLDISEQIVAYGHPFPESGKEFEPQRKKMLMKVMSHYGFPFNIVRTVYQKLHQIRVARIKRKQAKTSQS